MRVQPILAQLFLVSCVAACVPTLQIVSYKPGRLEPRGGRQLVLVEGEGHKEARAIAAALVDGEASGTWWRVDNRAPDGVKLVLANDAVTIVGDTRALKHDELWVRVDVVDWNLVETTVDEEDDDGNVTAVPAMQATVTLQAIVADANGHVLLNEQQYRAEVVVADGAIGPADPLTEAARVAAESFLDDISPRRVVDSVRLDDTDPGQKRILERLLKSKATMGETERALRRYLRKNEGNAIAHYNLGVVLDAGGKHEEAFEHYDAAIQIRSRDYYGASRADCFRRAQARKAVYGEPSPVKDAKPDEKPSEKPAEEKPVGEAPPPPST